MTEKFSATVKTLLTEVKQLAKSPVTLEIGSDRAGYLRHDQSYQERSADGSLKVVVADVTNIDYTASHELLHLLLSQQHYPQIHFNLTTHDHDLDQQLEATAVELYHAAVHVPIVAVQKQRGIIDDTVQAQYLKGIETVVPPEDPAKNDRLLIFRTLTLLDALVFYQGQPATAKKVLTARYPIAYQGAEQLYQILADKPIDSPFTLRRAVVKLFAAFDQWLANVGLAQTHHNQFVTLDGVFSQRQTHLEVRQLFQILHSELTLRDNKRSAYIGLGKNDQQNTFVLSAPQAEKKRADFFKQIYGQKMTDFLQKQHLPLLIR